MRVPPPTRSGWPAVAIIAATGAALLVIGTFTESIPIQFLGIVLLVIALFLAAAEAGGHP